MKKHLAGIVCLILIITLIGAVGCSSIQSALPTPEGVRVEGNILRWNSVSGASSYAIYDGNKEIAIESGTAYDLSRAAFSLGEHNLAVKAKGDGNLRIDSPLSATVTYTLTNSGSQQSNQENQHNEQNQNNGNENQNTNDNKNNQEEKPVISTDVATNNKLFNTGLGYGVDALNASSPIGNTRKGSFFDTSAFTLESFDIGSSKSSSTVKSDITSELIALNSKLVWNSEAHASYAGMFTSGFESKFSLDAAASSKTNINQLYYTMNIYKVGYNYQIKDYTVFDLFNDKLTSSAIADIERVNSGAMSANEFFARYGTHITMAVSYGEMVNVNYSYFSKTAIQQSDIKTALDMKLKAGLSYGFGSGSGRTELNTEFKEKYETQTSNTWTSLYVEGIGKNGFVALTFDELAQKYSDWEKQIDDENNYRIVDVCDGGLVPIWYYIPEKYQNAKNILSDYFNTTASKKASEIASKIAPPAYTIPESLTLNADKKQVTVKDASTDSYVSFDLTELKNVMRLYNLSITEITLSFYDKCINEGWHEFYIVNQNNDGTPTFSWKNYTFSFREGEVLYSNDKFTTDDRNPKEGLITQTIKKTIKESNLASLYVFFGAHGNGDDDWIASDITIKVKLESNS